MSWQSQQVGGSLNVNLHLLLPMCLFVLCVTKTTRKFKDVRVKIDGRINVGTDRGKMHEQWKNEKKKKDRMID